MNTPIQVQFHTSVYFYKKSVKWDCLLWAKNNHVKRLKKIYAIQQLKLIDW